MSSSSKGGFKVPRRLNHSTRWRSVALHVQSTPPEGLGLILYADDCSMLSTGTCLSQMSKKLNKYLETLLVWLSERNLKLSNEKSTSWLFAHLDQRIEHAAEYQHKYSIASNMPEPQNLFDEK